MFKVQDVFTRIQHIYFETLEVFSVSVLYTFHFGLGIFLIMNLK